jgi:hypothetical protein
MGKIRTPLPVKLVVSVLTSVPNLLEEAAALLAGHYGPVDSRSETFPFDLTSYYNRQMGTPISRTFFAFAELIEPSAIARIKAETNVLEEQIAKSSTVVPRPANLDPGYLDQAKIILASTKDFSHRVYLSGGIYAEVTLYYQNGEWKCLPWTFPDFRTGRYNPFFSTLRVAYRGQLTARGLLPE